MRLFGLIGNPLSHSFSAKYFADKFAVENVQDAAYQLFPLQDISEVMPLITLHTDLQGFNVTIPYKMVILPFLDEITEEAKAVGAVNCVRIKRDRAKVLLSGYNTDLFGFRESLVPLLKPYHHKALVLGTGGASKAVCYTLQQLGIAYLLVSRESDKANTIKYSGLTESLINDNLLIINTSPVGMYPEIELFPDIPFEFLTSRHVLYDLVYNPTETMFMKKGLAYGATVKNGWQMLELQAEKSWEIWNEG